MLKTKKHTFIFLFIVCSAAILSAGFFLQTKAATSQNPQDLLGIWKISGNAVKWNSKGIWEDQGVQDYENYYYEFIENSVCIGGLIVDDKITQPCNRETDAFPYRIIGNKLIIEEQEGQPSTQQWSINKSKLELISRDNKGSYKTIFEKLAGAKVPVQKITPIVSENLANVKCDGNFYQFRVGPFEIIHLASLFGDPEKIKKLENEELLYDSVELATNAKGYTGAPFKYSYYYKRDIDEVVGKSTTEKGTVSQGDSIWLVNLSTMSRERLTELGIQGDHLWDGPDGSGGRGADFAFSCEFTPVKEFKRGENPCTENDEGLVCDNLKEAVKNLGKVSELTLDYDYNANVPQLKKFPKQIRAMKRLQYLFINNQDFRNIPSAAFKNLAVLNSLFILQTPVTQLPSSVGNLRSLRYLNMGHTALRKIPKEIGKLRELVNLDLSYNQLREIPKELAQLRNLSVINLSYNQITDLPNELSQLKSSKETSFGGKGAPEDLPPEAFLIQIDLTGNPISQEKQSSLKKRFPNLHLKFNEDDSFFAPG